MRRIMLLGILAALTSIAVAGDPFPSLSIAPGYLAPAVTLNQTPSQVDLFASADVPYATAIGDVPAEYADDYRLSATLDFDTNNLTELGLVARADLTLLNCYEASLNPVNGYLVIVKITGAAAFENLAAHQLTGFDPSLNYDLDFTVEGSQLTASLYDTTGGLIKTISGTDSTFTTGSLGLFSFKPAGGGTNLSGSWINPEVVPEPATISLLVLSAAALIRKSYRLGA